MTNLLNIDDILLEATSMIYEAVMFSLENATLLYSSNICKLIPKRWFKHYIMIAEEYNNNCVSDINAISNICGWNIDYIDEIKAWLNENTKYPYFIVLHSPQHEPLLFKLNQYQRVCFMNKNDAATFKLYFK